MKRVVIHIQAGPGSTWRGRLLGAALVGIILSIFLLLMLGIWIAFAVAATLVTLVGLARAFFPSAVRWPRFSRQASPSVGTRASGSAKAPSLEMHGNDRSSGDESHTKGDDAR